MEKENESMNDMARRVMQEEVIAFGTPHREEHTEWEKEFNKYYGVMFECGDYEQLVEDIRALLKDQRERIAEKIEKEIDILPNGHYDHAFRDGLRHALRIIQEEE